MSTETTWVPQADYEAVLTAATDMRRTLALLHMRMSLGGYNEDSTLDYLRLQTGYTLADATAMRSVVEEFRPLPTALNPFEWTHLALAGEPRTMCEIERGEVNLVLIRPSDDVPQEGATLCPDCVRNAGL